MGLQYAQRSNAKIDWINQCKCSNCGPVQDELIDVSKYHPRCGYCGQEVKLTSLHSKNKVLTVEDKLKVIWYKQVIWANFLEGKT